MPDKQPKASGSRKNLLIVVITVAVFSVIAIYFFFVYPKYQTPIKTKPNLDDTSLPSIELEELKSIYTTNPNSILIVDVRPEEQFNLKHISGSINIPLAQLDKNRYKIPYTKEVVITAGAESCSVCSIATTQLLEWGYTNVRKFEAGVTEWEKAGLPLVGGVKNSFGYISPDDLYEKVKDRDEMFIVDIRNEEEYATDHIAGAVYIPFENISLASDQIPKDREVIIYDKTGDRARLAVDQLVGQGYTEIKVLLGGIQKWQEKNYPLIHD